jgi:hypothetical protein
MAAGAAPEPGSSTRRGLESLERLGFGHAVAIAWILVALRSAFWVFSESAHFDSDQAITGLMAKHLAEGRAFPLFFYGQHYMLAVEAWLAAPLFLVVGASVAALKLPLLLLNLLTAYVLLRLLVRHAGLSPAYALLASTFFVLPLPMVSKRLVEAQGGNIEPLLYALLLWPLRDRPIAFGFLAGFAILHREFTVYAVGAVILTDVVTARAFTRSRMREYLLAFGAMTVVRIGIGLLESRADLLGPGTAGTVGGGLSAQLPTRAAFLCWNPAELGPNLRWLFVENLGGIFGWIPQMYDFGRHHTVVSGAGWLAPLLGLLLALSLLSVVRNRTALKASAAGTLAFYLVATAVQAALVYAVLGCIVRDGTLVRYTLLTVYFPVGLLAAVFSVASHVRLRIVVVLVAVWGGVSLADNVRLLAGWARGSPSNGHRELANLLEAQGVRYAIAPYWTAYHLDFLTQERIAVASSDKVRITEYQRIVREHEAESVQIVEDASCLPEGARFRRWCLMYLERARTVR